MSALSSPAIAGTTAISPSVKGRQQARGPPAIYSVHRYTLQIVGELLAEACDLRTDERVLDVAAGNGNATLRPPGAAAR